MIKRIALVAAALVSTGAPQASAQEVFQPHPKTKLMAGLATASVITKTPTALAFGFSISDRQWIEINLGLTSVGGTSSFGLGGQFKALVVGDMTQGVHAGGALSLGTQLANTFVSLGGLAGVHITLPALERILFSIDGGAMLSVTSPRADFALSPLSAALGFSILYRI